MISFREGTGHIWLASVTCTGTEMRLADCLSDPLGDPNCRHYHDAHVLCWPQGWFLLIIVSQYYVAFSQVIAVVKNNRSDL